MDAVPTLELSARLFAAMVTVSAVATVAGAVYTPAEEMEPEPELMDHATDWLALPETVAVN
jgi:hypothetical protein